ncbi:MAG: ABC transporter ATP-binding protein [Chloroflexi bacterium]|nr:ABC transporter ATP-binding protein [Chloroflexota bacterium]
MLDVSDLRVEFPTVRGVFTAVNGVDFQLGSGERLGLIGESGSGKSTLALALMRLIKPPGRIAGGRVLLDGVDLLSLPEDEMRQRRLADIALVTQGAMNSLNPVMRVRPQMIDAMRAHRVFSNSNSDPNSNSKSKVSKSEWNERVDSLLASVRLRPETADLYPHQLSGGMKQRVCIAIAISLRPRVLVADEPTSALDVVVQRRVMQTLRSVQQQIGASVILIGHDMGLMAQFAERVAVMRNGDIIEVGHTRDIFSRPEHPYTRLLMESLPSLRNRGTFAAVGAATT